ncbi:MAG: Gfo/Idh/MocA family oxidoreductase [Galbitalea sp.]
MATQAPAEQPLGVVIVGCGAIAITHADAIARHPGVRLVALVDVDATAARSLADHVEAHGRPRPATVDSLTAALATGDISLVVICTPSGLHVALAEEALAAGSNVLIESPSTSSSSGPAASSSSPRRRPGGGSSSPSSASTVSTPRAWSCATRSRSGQFGRLTSGIASIAWWRDQRYYDSAAWRGTWELDGGGAAMNQGVHTIDLLLWILGRPIDVSARTATLAHERIEVEDTLVATVTFQSGALALIHATTAAYPNVGTRLQVHGSLGSAVIEDDQLLFFHASAREQEGNQAAALVAADQLRGNPRDPDSFVIGHLRQYEDVVDAIRSGRQPGVRVADAVLALAVIRGLYLSATLGRTVTIAEVLDGSLDDTQTRTDRYHEICGFIRHQHRSGRRRRPRIRWPPRAGTASNGGSPTRKRPRSPDSGSATGRPGR